MINFVLKNSPSSMFSCAHVMVTCLSSGVTWRDVTLCHGIFGSPVYPALPDTTGKAISEQSPGSPSISSYL
eukprot:495791-Amorphochlora_amoeboformis.AAC.1